MKIEPPSSDETLFTGVDRPVLPPRLRQRILARARASAGRRSWVDRLWENRRLRLAWCASVVVLLGVQWGLASSMSPGAPAPSVARSQKLEAVAPASVDPLSASETELDWLLARHQRPEKRTAGRLNAASSLRWLEDDSLL